MLYRTKIDANAKRVTKGHVAKRRLHLLVGTATPGILLSLFAMIPHSKCSLQQDIKTG